VLVFWSLPLAPFDEPLVGMMGSCEVGICNIERDVFQSSEASNSVLILGFDRRRFVTISCLNSSSWHACSMTLRDMTV
jgi:hypothetical protein